MTEWIDANTRPCWQHLSEVVTNLRQVTTTGWFDKVCGSSLLSSASVLDGVVFLYAWFTTFNAEV